MCSEIHRHDDCEELRDLIVWYPSGSLEEHENARIEAHIAACVSCSSLLRFSNEFKGFLVEKHRSHPDAAALVSYVENKTEMDPRERSYVEDHVTVCADCRRQAEMLEDVERDLGGSEEAYTNGALPGRIPSGRWRRLRDALGAGMFKPVPAAAYLVIALVAVGFHAFWTEDRGGKGRIGAGIVPETASGVVILADENSRVRRAVTGGPAAARIDGADAQYLLLELTGLEAPPPAAAVYTVELLTEDAAETVIRSTVEGAAFLDNYTICVPLGAGALERGGYAIRVIDPDDVTVFRSRIIVD